MKWLLVLFAFSVPAVAVDTTIKGGRMELINKGDTIVFSHGVRLVRGDDEMKAREMKTNRDRDRISAYGDVRLFRKASSTETWQAFGDSGFYDTKAGAGYLQGRKKEQAHVIRTEILSSTMTRVVHLHADRIDLAQEGNKAYARGSVHGNSVDPGTGDVYEFWADQADFDGPANTILLTGATQPLVVQTLETGRRSVRGDKIVYNTAKRNMISEGNAEAVFEDKPKGKKK